jgi:hypothetical protein
MAIKARSFRLLSCLNSSANFAQKQGRQNIKGKETLILSAGTAFREISSAGRTVAVYTRKNNKNSKSLVENKEKI